MPRTLTSDQLSNVQQEATRPVYLVDWEHSGTQELIACTSGAVVYDGMTFNAGDLKVVSIDGGKSAQLSMPASPTRGMEVQNGTWRMGYCKIYLVPALPGDTLTFVEADGLLVLDGEIRSSALSGNSIGVSVQSTSDGVILSPRHTFDAVSNHLPAAGTIISWEGDQLVL
jgi:hypothetical protein